MSRVSTVFSRFTKGDPLAETDWSRFEHEIGRAMRADEPNSCAHYHYLMGPNDLYSAQVGDEIVNMCRHCRQPF
jgi:hypothetical protein